MIHIVHINGTKLMISVSPEVVQRNENTDQQNWLERSNACEVNKKKYYRESSTLFYLEDDSALHISALIVDEINRTHDLTDIKGTAYYIAVAFDSAVYLMGLLGGENRVIVQYEAFLTKDDALAKLKDITEPTFFIAAGRLTETLEQADCIDSETPLDFLSAPKEYVFSRVWSVNLVLSIVAGAVVAAVVLYLASSMILSMLPKEEKIIPVAAPKIKNDLAKVISNMAGQQNDFIVFLHHGIKELGIEVVGSDISMRAAGQFESRLTQKKFARLSAIADVLEGKLNVSGKDWEITELTSPLRFVRSEDLRPLNDTLFAAISLAGRHTEILVGDRHDRKDKGGYSEYTRAQMIITDPTPSRLLRVVERMSENNAQAQYLSHEYEFKNDRLSHLHITFLIRGNDL